MARIKYETAEDIKKKVELIVKKLGLEHIKLERLHCVRSYGSNSKIIARCHTLPKIMQQVLSMEPVYVIELIAENFDKQKEEEQIKTLIHELLHIPKTFGGGFLYHNIVTKAKVEKLYNKFKNSSLKSKDTVEQKI